MIMANSFYKDRHGVVICLWPTTLHGQVHNQILVINWSYRIYDQTYSHHPDCSVVIKRWSMPRLHLFAAVCMAAVIALKLVIFVFGFTKTKVIAGFSVKGNFADVTNAYSVCSSQILMVHVRFQKEDTFFVGTRTLS